VTKHPTNENYLEYLKKQKWLIPVLIIIFLILLGSMFFLSENSSIAPFLYQKF
jgi:hypothetical protein